MKPEDIKIKIDHNSGDVFIEITHNSLDESLEAMAIKSFAKQAKENGVIIKEVFGVLISRLERSEKITHYQIRIKQ